jgi:hypothetical protein
MTKSKAIVITYEQFAEGCGRTDGMTLNASDDYHKQYLKLDADGKANRELVYVTNYVVGYTDSRKTMPSMTLKQAIDAFGKKRTERSRNEELAVNAGKAKFRYHISRPEKSDGKKPAVKFTPAQRQACDNALASFPATKLADQIKMLRAYLTSLEAQ